MVNVRLTEAIDVDGTKAGAMFRSLVDDPVMLDGKVVIPRSAVVIVQAVSVAQSGAMKGSGRISLKANSITFGGQTYEVVTAYVEAKGAGEGKKSARKIGGGAGLGAVVGGIAGGGQGAAIGAAVGGADWRGGRQPGAGTPEAAGRNPPAVPIERGGHGQAVAAGVRRTESGVRVDRCRCWRPACLPACCCCPRSAGGWRWPDAPAILKA